MAKLLFEIWEGPNSSECAAVSESWDRLRDDEMIFREAFFASSQDEAMSYYYQSNGWGPYEPIPGPADVLFTQEQLTEQEDYLKIRGR